MRDLYGLHLKPRSDVYCFKLNFNISNEDESGKSCKWTKRKKTDQARRAKHVCNRRQAQQSIGILTIYSILFYSIPYSIQTLFRLVIHCEKEKKKKPSELGTAQGGGAGGVAFKRNQ